MATVPDPNLDLSEQVARIDKMQAELQKLLAETVKVKQDTRFAPFTLMATTVGATTALIGAVAAVTKILAG